MTTHLNGAVITEVIHGVVVHYYNDDYDFVPRLLHPVVVVVVGVVVAVVVVVDVIVAAAVALV